MDSNQYPHLSPEQVQTLSEIDATPEQYRSSDISARNAIYQSLQKYRYNAQSLVVLVTGATGSGKSATANTILGRKVFQEGSSATSVTTQVQEDSTDVDGLRLTVVDTPFSWHTTLDNLSTVTVDAFILVINLASPRFGQAELNDLRSLHGPDGSPLLQSGRCVVVLSHADSALHQLSLKQYLAEIEGDPLHTLLTKDLQGRIIAVNNAAGTQFERQSNQRAIMYLALQAKGGKCISKKHLIGTSVLLVLEVLLGSTLFHWALYGTRVKGLTMAYTVLLHSFLFTLQIDRMWGKATGDGGATSKCVRCIAGTTAVLVVTNFLGAMIVRLPLSWRDIYVIGMTGMGVASAARLVYRSKRRSPIYRACAIGALSIAAGFLYTAMHIYN